LIVNYRTLRLTSLCLSLLEKHIDQEKTDVIVVDNGSNDESLEYLKSLDWIRLIERTQESDEPAFISHGRALDEGLEYVTTPYVCLLHTDTFVYDSNVFELLLAQISHHNVAAVGTRDQRHRKPHKRIFRICKKIIRYYFRKLTLTLGLSKASPKPIRDNYLKSFCCMWDVNLIRSRNLKFTSEMKNPGYKIQDELTQNGFIFVDIGTSTLFKFLSHIQSGTVVELNNIGKNQRRKLEYEKLIEEAMSATKFWN